MATILDIVRGISQVVANSYDGALDEKGEPIKIGLKREEGDAIKDSRIMDGFKVSFSGNQICIHYHSEVKLKDTHDKDFESELEQTIEDIASFIKKEYKKITGSALTLKKSGELEAIMQNTSRVRSWVQAKCHYDIGGADADPVAADSEESVNAKFKSFLDQGGWDGESKAKGQPVYQGKGKVKGRKDIHSSFKAE